MRWGSRTDRERRWQGFDMAKLTRSTEGGFGLFSLRERVKHLGGTARLRLLRSQVPRRRRFATQ